MNRVCKTSGGSMRIPCLFAGFAVIALLGLASPALAEDDAASFIAQTGDAVLSLARDQNLSDQQLKEQLRTIADQDFDSPRIAQFVLGRHWRSASDAERQQFVKAFEEYMVQVYATRFRQYSGAIFKVVGQRQEAKAPW